MVDPGDEPERIRGALEAAGLRCGAILITHTHHDHIGAVGALARSGSVPVYVSRGEASILSAPETGLGSGLGHDRGVRGGRAPGRRGAPRARGARGRRPARAGSLSRRGGVPDHRARRRRGGLRRRRDLRRLGRPHRLPGLVVARAGAVDPRALRHRRASTCRSTRATGPRRRSGGSAPRTRSSTPSEPVERRLPVAPRHARLAARARCAHAGTWSSARATIFERAGYREVATPVFEDTGLFARTSGEGSEVVQKEMYSFQDKGERPISLRPELTAPLMRAYLGHGMGRLPQPVRLWTVGACYRYNAVQRGRLREFHQFDAEAIGSVDPASDAELIALQAAWYGEPRHRRAGARAELRRRRARTAGRTSPCSWSTSTATSASSRTTCGASATPTRCGRSTPRTSARRRSWPRRRRSPTTCRPARAEHFEAVQRPADRPRRGLPRRARRSCAASTTTRARRGSSSGRSSGAQSTIGGGGRYDGLAEAIGGPPTPGRRLRRRRWSGCCWRSARPRRRTTRAPTSSSRSCTRRRGRGCWPSSTRRGRRACRARRTSPGRGAKGQFRQADRSGARLTVVVGEDEWSRGAAAIRDMTTGEQVEVPLDGLVPALAERIGR